QWRSTGAEPHVIRFGRQEIGQCRAPGTRSNDGDTCSVDVLGHVLHPVHTPGCLPRGSGALAPVLRRCLCSPGTGAAYRLLPATVETITMSHGHLWRIGTVQTPVRCNLVLAFPIAHS